MDNPNRMKAHFITESEINKPVATMISSERGVHFELSELAPQPQGAVSHRTSVKPEDVPAPCLFDTPTEPIPPPASAEGV